jgi:hypothetical protein
MPGVRRFGVEERRARLGVRHHLASADRAAGPVEAVRDLVAIHSTDPASVYVGLAARVRDPSAAAIEGAIYHERRLVRMLGMRRTVFVVPVEHAATVHAACTRPIAERERALLVRMLEGAGITRNGARWLRDVERSAMRALEARGEATAAELSQDEPRLQRKIRVAEGKRYEGTVGVSTRVLFLLAAEGRAVRGRPRGSWMSTQYRWSPIDAWLPGGMPELPKAEARADLARQWLRAFGPATVTDLRWWMGLAVAGVKAALAAIGAVEVDLDGVPGVALPDDLESTPSPGRWVALLPALDTTTMGWSARSWFLGGHGPALFDRSGNAGPTVWVDGRVVGGWAHRPDGGIAVALLEDVGLGARRAIDREAERLSAWIGDLRIVPRFRTPIELELGMGG